MQIHALFTTVLLYVALVAHVVYALPVPSQSEPTDFLTRDVADVYAELSLRDVLQPLVSEEIVSRDWKANMKKYVPWKKKEAPPHPKKLEIMVKTEVMQHYDSLGPHKHVEHPVNGKYERPQVHPAGPRHQYQQYGVAITTDHHAVAKPQPIWDKKPLPPPPPGEPHIWKPLPPRPLPPRPLPQIPHGHQGH